MYIHIPNKTPSPSPSPLPSPPSSIIHQPPIPITLPPPPQHRPTTLPRMTESENLRTHKNRLPTRRSPHPTPLLPNLTPSPNLSTPTLSPTKSPENPTICPHAFNPPPKNTCLYPQKRHQHKPQPQTLRNPAFTLSIPTHSPSPKPKCPSSNIN